MRAAELAGLHGSHRRGLRTASSSKSSTREGDSPGVALLGAMTWPSGRRTGVPDTTIDDERPW